MNDEQRPAESPDSTERAKDPVCGMMVKRESPRGGTFEHKGTTYYFCNEKHERVSRM
jgi:YHS domain-containing protein